MNLSALVASLESSCRSALEEAAGACVNRGGHEITIEDYMEKLISTNMMQDIITQFELNKERLYELLRVSRPQNESSSSRPVFSPLLISYLQESYLLASLEMGYQEINAGILVLTLLVNPARYSIMPFYRELGKIASDKLRNLLEGLKSMTAAKSSPAAGISGEDSALQNYTTDFTEEARLGKIDPVFSRGPAIRQMIDILTRRRKNNPILVGDPGVGKTAVVEGLALKVVHNDVPDALRGVRIAGLDMGRLQAGASMKGEFEKRLKGVIDEVKSSPVPTILFIDEAHTLVGTGNTSGSGDGANLLKPALARGELRTVAATTWSEYKKYFEKDAALARRFQLVRLDEPSLEDTVTILRGLAPHYEKAHKVYVRDDAITRTAELAARYISGRQLPDKAIDVLDTACAKVKVSLGAKPAILERKQEELGAVSRELEAFERDSIRGVTYGSKNGRYGVLKEKSSLLRREIETIETQWQKEKNLITEIIDIRTGEDNPESHNGRLAELINELHIVQNGQSLVFYEVNPNLAAEIVADWTGIPLQKLSNDDADALQNFGQRLRVRIKGQEHALSVIEKAVLASRTGLNNPNTPSGIFLLVGPSGVGKTETALAVADELFGGERFLISINGSEFQEKHTISRLIGSPPGYVGYGEGGRLTEAVRRQPYSAVLFDEVEKAHPDILNLFYQVFDKGVLADGEGREIDFKNTMIFMTSNIGGDIIAALCEDGEIPDSDILLEAVRPALTQFFKPALLGRMTVAPYAAIPYDILKILTEIKLAQIARRLQATHQISMAWSDPVVENIVKSCKAVDTGARNIDHIINSSLLPDIAAQLLGRMNDKTDIQSVFIDLNIEINKFIYHFSKN
ncbi:MAG: type VI secretion system ATPase TssH [Desulfarculales bacterium]|nr:type VI secretion system ATPase TssH [Desulfarculales bacterium]